MSLPSLDWCKGPCGVLKPIVNKHFGLCEECNYKRLHDGKTKEQVYRERHNKKVQDHKPIFKKPDVIDKRSLVDNLKEKFSIKKISNKKAERDRKMHATYKIIDQTREPICEGCGRGGIQLSHSHILSQATRPDLADDEDNIRLHCFGQHNTCHEKWERGVPADVVMMLDFKDNLRYIQSVDPKKYNKIIVNLEFHQIKI